MWVLFWTNLWVRYSNKKKKLYSLTTANPRGDENPPLETQSRRNPTSILKTIPKQTKIEFVSGTAQDSSSSLIQLFMAMSYDRVYFIVQSEVKSEFFNHCPDYRLF